MFSRENYANEPQNTELEMMDESLTSSTNGMSLKKSMMNSTIHLRKMKFEWCSGKYTQTNGMVKRTQNLINEFSREYLKLK